MKTKTMVVTALMAAVISVISPLTVPIGPVPVSLQILVVLLAVYLLGMKYGTLSYFIYLCIGMLGIPVFSGFEGGIHKIAGPTGGYLIGMIFTAAVAGWFIERFPDNPAWQIFGITLGIILCYVCGTAWLMVVTNLSLWQALMAGVIPFIPFDIAKTAIAVLVGRPARSRLHTMIQLT